MAGLAANGSGYLLTAQRPVGYNSPVRAPRERSRSGFIKTGRALIQNAEQGRKPWTLHCNGNSNQRTLWPMPT